MAVMAGWKINLAFWRLFGQYSNSALMTKAIVALCVFSKYFSYCQKLINAIKLT